MRLSPSCYMLAGFGFTPPWSVNAGFIAGAQSTLVVDTGPSAMAAQTILGYARATRLKNNIRAVNTEQHMDHILGNCVFFDEGIEIIGHASMVRTEADFQATVAEYNAAILDEPRRRASEGIIFFGGTRVQPPTVTFHEETRLDLGGLVASLLPAPGHTPSNLLVWVEAEGVLFTGDTVVTGYIPNLDGGGREDWRRWQESLAVIQSLHPAIIVPGHGAHLTGTAMQPAIAQILSVLETAIQSGKSPTAT
jgi:glyoxylase-like metal-dependent hydrolase (beta-lactamase superfamily II)